MEKHNDDNMNSDLENVGHSGLAKDIETSTSIVDEGEPVRGVDVVMEDDGDDDIGRDIIDQEDDYSDREDNDDDEEEDMSEYVGQSKSNTRGKELDDSVFDAFSFNEEGASSAENAECVNSLHSMSEEWVGQDVINTAHVSTVKEFVCVKFPGVIKNKDKALACLGGVKNIMEARKLGKIDMTFRPDDPYSKAAVGMYAKNSHLLVKCMRRRKAQDVNQPSTSAYHEDELDDGYEYKVEVIGIVCGIYRFERPCDFQYLPVMKKADGEGYKEILSDLMVNFDDDRHEYLNRDMPLFLPPYIFSRSERLAKYIFQDDEKTKEQHIGFSRKMRHLGSYRVTFPSTDIPTTPHPSAIAIMKGSKANIEPLKELFRERPMWSKVGVKCRMRAIGEESLVKHLAMVAYLCHTGPWVRMWCRLGYDPQKNVEAKMYQTIDLRIRNSILRDKLTAKRKCTYSLGRQGLNTVHGHQLPGTLGVMDKKDTASGGSVSTEQAYEPQYQFVPGHIPPCRQMHYQVCDIFNDEVQKLAHQNDGKETECAERDGWCIPDFASMCREILQRETENLLWTSFKEDPTTKDKEEADVT